MVTVIDNIAGVLTKSTEAKYIVQMLATYTDLENGEQVMDKGLI